MAQSRQDTLLSLVAGQIRPTVKAAAGVVTWKPGMALPGMSMAQTKAYQSKLPKPAAGAGTGAQRAQPMPRATLGSARVARQSAVPNASKVMSADPKMTAAFQSSRRSTLGSAWVARQSAASPAVLRDMALVRGGSVRRVLNRGVTGRGATVLDSGARPTVLNTGVKPTVLSGASRGTVLQGTGKGTVLSGTSRGTVLSGASRGTVLGGTNRGTVLGKKAEKRTDVNGRKYNLLQAIRTPSYTAKPPNPPKTVVPDVQYGTPKAITPGSDSTKPTTSSGSEAPQPVKVAQQSKEWDSAMSSLRTGRRAPVKPRGLSAPVYPTAPKVLPRTGDSYYDNLQSTKDRLEREAIEQREQEVFRKSNIQQEITPEQLQQRMKGFRTWGESAPGWLKNVVAATHKAIASPQTTSVGGPSMLMDHTLQQKVQGNPGFTTPMSDGDAAAAANDTLNNWQQTWERAKQYGGNALRSMATLPSYLSNSYSAKKFRQGVANANANASALADARIDAITKKYQTGLQDDPTLAAINNAVAGGTGAVLGELAAGGAVGKTLGAGAKVVRGVTGTAGRIAGNTVTGALRPAMQKVRYVQSGFGSTAKNLAAAEGRATPTIATRNAYARAMTSGPYDDRLVWASRAGKTVRPGQMGAFEERLGNAVQHGFQSAGDVAATPLQLGSDALLHPFQTANAGYAKVAPGFRVLRHPVQYAQRAGRAIATHPIKAPVKAVWNGAQRTVFNPTVYGYTQMPGFYGDLYRGDYGSAAGRAGGVGSFGFRMRAPGAAQIPMAVRDFRSFGGE